MEKTPQTPPETIDTAEEGAVDGSSHSESGKGGHAPRAKKQKIVLTAEMKADPVSKKLIQLSFGFASLAVLCIGFLTYVHYQKKHAHHEAPVEEVHKPAAVITQDLTEIAVKLKNDQELRAELAAECNQRETCDFIKDHPAQVRDLLIPILTSIDPDTFSNIENKQLIRKKLTDRLNTFEMPGKVIQVHFTNLSIEGEAKGIDQ